LARGGGWEPDPLILDDQALIAHVAGRRGAFDKAELNSEIQSSMAIGEQAETFRQCPKCSSVDYAQRLVRP